MIIGLLVVGCEKRVAPPPPQTPVFGTVYALADLLRQIGGESVSVDWAIETPAALEQFSPDAAVRDRMDRAQFLLAGGGFDNWVGNDSALMPMRILRITAFAGDDASEGYGWLDPVVAMRSCDAIARRLAIVRPDHAAEFIANAATVRQNLQQLVDRNANQSWPRCLATTHAFDALANRFKIELIHVAIGSAESGSAGFDDASVNRLRAVAREQKIAALIVGFDVPPSLAADLQLRLKVRVIRLDPVGSSAGTGRDTYQALIQFDLDQLSAARPATTAAAAP